MIVWAWNGRDALLKTARTVLREGEEVSPRGLRTREIRGYEVLIEHPTDALMPGINANFGPKVVAAEALQLIGGFSDPAFAVRMVPSLARFRNSTGGFDGAYGPAVREQLLRAYYRLREDSDTRQAVVTIWSKDHALLETSKDFPCTIGLHFLIRGGRLELDVLMRSNDVDLGFKHDVGQFTQLQLTVASTLGIEPGPYRHRASSMHLYETSWDWAENLDDTSYATPIPDHPRGIDGGGTSPINAMNRARMLAAGQEPIDMTESERWYLERVKL